MGFKVPEQYRLTPDKHQLLGSTSFDGNNGMFIFRYKGYEVRCKASDGYGWEHVSVSINRERCPGWDVMCYVKKLFWGSDKDGDNEWVLQLHPPESKNISIHPYYLHLWRPIKEDVNLEVPIPPPYMV